MVLISRHPVATDVQARRDEVEKVLRRFKDSCFSQDDADAIIEEPRLLTEAEFREYFVDGTLDAVANINPLGGKNGATSWIITDEKGNYLMVAKTGKLTNSPCSPTNKIGVRPIVKVSSTSFKNITK